MEFQGLKMSRMFAIADTEDSAVGNFGSSLLGYDANSFARLDLGLLCYSLQLLHVGRGLLDSHFWVDLSD